LTPAARLGSQLLFIVLVVIMLGLITFPLWRTRVFPDPVTTRFSQLPAEQQKAINSLPSDERNALLQLAEQNPQQAADTAVALLDIPLSLSDDIRFLLPVGQVPTLIREGTFSQIDVIHGASGTAQVYKSGTSYFLSLIDMTVTPGPELHVGFAADAAPTLASRATWFDAGVLKGQLGNMVYKLPNTFKIDSYKSVVIFSGKYGTISSVAPFGP